MFGPNTSTKVFTCRYRQLRSIGLIDRTRLTEEERRYADIRPQDGLGADDPEYSTAIFTPPFDPDVTIQHDHKTEILRGGKGCDRRNR